MNKQQLASTIWESANQMRSKIEAREYKDFILGFIFYKYLSDKEVRFFKSKGLSQEDIISINEDDEEYAEYVRNNLGYFISYEHLFSTWIAKGGDFEIANVRDALSAFDSNIDSVYKKLFENIFKTLSGGLSKLGENAQKQTKAAKSLINLIKRIPMDGSQDYDVLGFVYEYLISMFATNDRKKVGEFYTPHGVFVLMSEIIANHLKNEVIPQEVIKSIKDYSIEKWVFNANFERVCLSKCLGEYKEIDSWYCSMVWSAYLGLPLSFENQEKSQNYIEKT
ncbi:type I restriction system adenine methylase HsdM [Peptoniphilus sp. ING2-D1G]|nr:type I restriction system adenine methylase HsdM [Peptoniphilus sp. ING2-D1G]